MPIYDLICKEGHKQYDQILKIGERPPCPTCQSPTETLWEAGSTPNIVGDEIPGGVEIRHGICNEDGSPRRYYSKSEIAKEAKARGLVQAIRHAPTPGSDKAPYTSKWY